MAKKSKRKCCVCQRQLVSAMKKEYNGFAYCPECYNSLNVCICCGERTDNINLMIPFEEVFVCSSCKNKYNIMKRKEFYDKLIDKKAGEVLREIEESKKIAKKAKAKQEQEELLKQVENTGQEGTQKTKKGSTKKSKEPKIEEYKPEPIQPRKLTQKERDQIEYKDLMDYLNLFFDLNDESNASKKGRMTAEIRNLRVSKKLTYSDMLKAAKYYFEIEQGSIPSDWSVWYMPYFLSSAIKLEIIINENRRRVGSDPLSYEENKIKILQKERKDYNKGFAEKWRLRENKIDIGDIEVDDDE